MKKAVIIAIALLLAAGGAYWYFGRNGNGMDYRTAAVERGPLRAAVTATGTVNPVTSVQVGTQVSGRIKALYADFNSHVAKGDLLAEIDPTTFEAQLEQARANLAAAEAAVEKAEATLRDAERNEKRNRELLEARVLSQSDMDQARTNLDLARAGLSGARANRRQAKAAVDFAETNLRYTRILSPVGGTVISRSVDVGQTVAASFQTPTLFTIARDLAQMQIDTNVNEADIGRVATGQAVEFTVDAYSDTTFKGVVEQIRIAPAVVQNVVTYDVVVRVENKDLKLKPGMTANVNIIVETREAVLKVPNAALRFKPKNDKDNKDKKDASAFYQGSGVWILDGAVPRRITVATGISDGSFTEIAAAELKEGTPVIIDSGVKSSKNNPRGHRLF